MAFHISQLNIVLCCTKSTHVLVSIYTHQQDFLETPTQHVDNVAHVRHQDKDANGSETAQDHKKLCTTIGLNMLRHPASKDQTNLK